MKYRKKPVVIDAWPVKDLIRDATHNWFALPAEVRYQYELGGMVIAGDHIDVPTLEGSMRADYNDMMICGVKGELYPCKPDIFEATYESAE